MIIFGAEMGILTEIMVAGDNLLGTSSNTFFAIISFDKYMEFVQKPLHFLRSLFFNRKGLGKALIFFITKGGNYYG